MSDKTVVMFGGNEYGQCDPPNLQGRSVAQVECGDYHTALLYTDGSFNLFG